MAGKKASAKSTPKGGRKADSGKKAATKKPAEKTAAKTKTKAAAPKAAKSGKKGKAAESDFTFKTRKAGSVDDVKTALAASNYGRFLYVSGQNPERQIRILDDPKDWNFYDRHWPKPGAKHACMGAGCPTCAGGDQPLSDVVYFRVALVDPETGKATRIMLYEPPKTVSKALLAHAKRRGTLTDRDYIIERTGTGRTDTVYTVMPEDKKSRSTELKKLEKDDPVDEAVEFERLWNEHLTALNKSDNDEDEDEDDVTTAGGAASPLDDDDEDEDDDDTESDEDEDDDDSDEDDDEDSDDEDEEEDDDEAEDDDDEDDESEDDDEDSDDDDESDEDEDEDEDDDDSDEDEDDESEPEGGQSQSGIFKIESVDADEGTLSMTNTETGENLPAVFYDEDETDISFKKGLMVKAEIEVDDEDDWVVTDIAISKAKAKAAPAKGKAKAKKK